MANNRNKPCHCGSGKKYKNCCLAEDSKPKVKVEVEEPVRSPEEIEEDMQIFKALSRCIVGY